MKVLCARLLSPALIARHDADPRVRDSLDYLPSRILRGAWARHLRNLGKEKEIPTLVSKVRIPNLFPSRHDGSSALVPSRTPLSLYTCKSEGLQHGYVDTLLDADPKKNGEKKCGFTECKTGDLARAGKKTPYLVWRSDGVFEEAARGVRS